MEIKPIAGCENILCREFFAMSHMKKNAIFLFVSIFCWISFSYKKKMSSRTHEYENMYAFSWISMKVATKSSKAWRNNEI